MLSNFYINLTIEGRREYNQSMNGPCCSPVAKYGWDGDARVVDKAALCDALSCVHDSAIVVAIPSCGAR